MRDQMVSKVEQARQVEKHKFSNSSAAAKEER